jgi:hypothetical protein
METTMTIAIVTTQGHSDADRRKTCAHASMEDKARPCERRRVNSHHGALASVRNRRDSEVVDTVSTPSNDTQWFGSNSSALHKRLATRDTIGTALESTYLRRRFA